MSETLPLFEEPTNVFRNELRERVRRLTKQQILLGASSWKYEGWLGQIYSRDRYTVHGRFSKRRFEQECLQEYADTFPTVCGDFAFYQFPTPDFWKRLFEELSPKLKFSLKVPEEITASCYPSLPRYGAKAGQKNVGFLDFNLLDAMFLRLLQPYRTRVPLLIFEFGASSTGAFSHSEFLERLYAFINRLPDDFRYAIEVRDPELLDEPSYWTMLQECRVTHVFNAWTKMPPLRQQMVHLQAFTSSFVVIRALLKTGRSYNDAVRQFSPYDEVREPDLSTRQAIRDIIVECIRHGRPAFIYVNNRLEGNAPATIYSILSEVELKSSDAEAQS